MHTYFSNKYVFHQPALLILEASYRCETSEKNNTRVCFKTESLLHVVWFRIFTDSHTENEATQTWIWNTSHTWFSDIWSQDRKNDCSLLVTIMYVVILECSISYITGLISNVNYNIELILTSYHSSSAPLIECYQEIHKCTRKELSLQIFHWSP